MDSSTYEVELNNSRDKETSNGIWSTPTFGQNGEPRIHKIIQLLNAKQLVYSRDEMDLNVELTRYHERAWEMETTQSLRLGRQPRDDAAVPLFGLRKALCVRILNYFSEGSRTAYTIWVYDVRMCLCAASFPDGW